MFERIARRHADPSDESAPADPTSQPATEDAATTDEQATVDLPAVEAPTERRGPLSPPSDEPAAAPAADVPPPAMDLTTRLPLTPAAAPPATEPQPAGPATQPEPAAAPAAPPTAATEQTTADQPEPRRPGFRARGRMRRRLRYLRKLRELQVRDLGGLVFDLRRFERSRDDLIAQKIDHIRACDDELHALERALGERRDLRDVREPGVGGTCPRCFAIHGSADKFCANCGAALGGAVQGPATPA
ncbi:MAG: hypothetical protein JSS99_17220 [Actinobacteria bacterium]|nr:hypothetical protein [Actinomycetota bacterium]